MLGFSFCRPLSRYGTALCRGKGVLLALCLGVCLGLCLGLAGLRPAPALAQDGGAAGAPGGDPVVIAALGDSLTQGYGLTPDQGLVAQLQAWLDARGVAARLINAGVSGDTSAGGLARADWTLTPDVDALILALGGNDMLRGILPAATRANLAGILDIAAARPVPVLVVGMRAPGNYGPDYAAAFNAIYPDLAKNYDALLMPSLLGPLGDDPAKALPFLQGDAIHPNGAGVARIVDALGPQVIALIARIDAP